MWLLPKQHGSSFENNQSPVYASLARVLKDNLMRMDAVLDHPAYNFMLHTSPVGEESNEHYHWHIEIMPKLTKVAGFEWGTGFYICPTPPEESARFLREAHVDVTPALNPDVLPRFAQSRARIRARGATDTVSRVFDILTSALARYPRGPRERSAKPPFVGSNPTRASKIYMQKANNNEMLGGGFEFVPTLYNRFHCVLSVLLAFSVAITAVSKASWRVFTQGE